MSPLSGSSAGRNVAELRMTSSANDVWGAIFASTTVFPEHLPKLYKEIRPTKGDGYSQDSMREITYAYDSGLVDAGEPSIEEIQKVDHGNMTVNYSVTHGVFKEHHETFDTAIKVTPVQGSSSRELGCIASWSCDYTGATGGLSPDMVKAFMIKTFEGLDNHLKNLRKTYKSPQ
ncbi:MLP-like protein 423 [Linum grandiflorum]